MIKKLTVLLICVLIGACVVSADENAIPDGRWLCTDLQGNVTQDTPADLKNDFGLYVNKEWMLSV